MSDLTKGGRNVPPIFLLFKSAKVGVGKVLLYKLLDLGGPLDVNAKTKTQAKCHRGWDNIKIRSCFTSHNQIVIWL